MAAPQLLEAVIKSSNKIILSFDKPFDDSVDIPVTSFSVNYGRIPISEASYYGTAEIVLTLDKGMTYRDKLEVNYQPPDDVLTALRGTVPSDAAVVAIRRNVLRAFFKVPVKNLIRPDENAWTANSNLGGGKKFVPDPDDPELGGDIPSIDICGDGSIIIGVPPVGGDGDTATGTITGLKDRVGGSGYVDGTYVNVPLLGGSGSGAEATLTITSGEVATIILSEGGSGYLVDDLLSVDDAAVGGGGGIDFAVTVATVTEATTTTTTTTTTRGNGAAAQLKDLGYPLYDRPSPRAATPDDFVMAYGLREAIQLSNIDNADAIEPNTPKIWMAIEDACALIDNYIQGASRAGKILISSSRRRTSLIIARYYLDTVRRRDDVKEDYERALTELDKARSLKDVQRPQLPWWADPCNPNNGGVLSHRIPQYYNGVSGKGLSGWWVDSGYSEVDDTRYDRDNSEGNNDQDNGGGGAGGSGGRIPSQPTEDGGENDGGDTP